MTPVEESFAEVSALLQDMQKRGVRKSLSDLRRELGLRLPLETMSRDARAANDRPRPRLLAKV